MPFNLLTTPWLEIRRRSGARAVVRPSDLVDDIDSDPIAAFDFPRADWNAAVTELIIGLVFLALAPSNHEEWRVHFESPPTPSRLQDLWLPFLEAFNLDGDGARAFQDIETLADQQVKPVERLLIDSPGENTLLNNADVFVKRHRIDGLSRPYAAAALVTLQTYAPSGGVGHRTSMRGGGPLTTLVAPLRAGFATPTLWDTIWANLPYRDSNFTDVPSALFPWLSPAETSSRDEVLLPHGRPLALSFFACPRRIRLAFCEGVCSLSKLPGIVCQEFRMQNYGPNYQGWQHPLSPHFNDKKFGIRPVLASTASSGFRDWIVWWGFRARPAAALDAWGHRRRQVDDLLDPHNSERIEAFGYDMDKMKARSWLNARAPWVSANSPQLTGMISDLISAAEATATALCLACQTARYGDGREKLGQAMQGSNTHAETGALAQFWNGLEKPFIGTIERAIACNQERHYEEKDLRENWSKTLHRLAIQTFENAVDIEGLTNDHPRRLLVGRELLISRLASVKIDLKREDGSAAQLRAATSVPI